MHTSLFVVSLLYRMERRWEIGRLWFNQDNGASTAIKLKIFFL